MCSNAGIVNITQFDSQIPPVADLCLLISSVFAMFSFLAWIDTHIGAVVVHSTFTNACLLLLLHNTCASNATIYKFTENVSILNRLSLSQLREKNLIICAFAVHYQQNSKAGEGELK